MYVYVMLFDACFFIVLFVACAYLCGMCCLCLCLCVVVLVVVVLVDELVSGRDPRPLPVIYLNSVAVIAQYALSLITPASNEVANAVKLFAHKLFGTTTQYQNIQRRHININTQ